MVLLRYGARSAVRLDFAAGVLSGEYGTPALAPLDDLRAAVAAALEDPLEYPPLRQITTPSDQVTLALDCGVPHVDDVAAAVIHALVEGGGVGPDGISILRTKADADAGLKDPCGLLPAEWRRRIRSVVHDPSDRKRMAYLAASESGDPILLNRLLTDADVVLPIGCLRSQRTSDYYGIHGSIFPGFSDQSTVLRFHSGSSRNGRSRQPKLVSEADHVAWLLGVNFTIQLVPAGGASVLHVLAGQTDAVRRRGQELYRAAWNARSSERASLVVAAIEGDAPEQSWENFGRALESAAAVVQEGGAIALCTDLAASPGPAMRCVAKARSPDMAVRRISKDQPPDALPALRLAQSLQHNSVYLLSRLDPQVVEDLDMIPIADADELVRLTRHHRSCIVLANAPRVAVTVDED